MVKPNILMVVVDQLRFDCVGFSCRYPVSTPNLDRFAASATWFKNAFTPIPLCCPARQALLTGQTPETLGTHWNYDLGPRIPGLTPKEWTWSCELSGAGYASAYVGKWHVSPDHDPTSFGFDRYVPESAHNEMRAKRYPTVAYHNGFFGEPDPLPLEDSRTHWLMNQAVEAIEEFSNGNAPWLVRLDLSEPHLPCRPAKPFAEMFKPDDVPEWGSFRDQLENKPYIQRQQLLNWRVEDWSWDDWAPTVAHYYNIIAQVDDAFGRLLAALQESGEADNTAVIFTTDHGDMCGGHRMMDKHYVMYDDIVHVPLAIRLPGQTEGRISDAFVSNILDLPPTLLELAGLESKDDLIGDSLMPTLRGDTCCIDERDDIVATYNGQQFGLYTQRMLRTRLWKYVWNSCDIDELYDLVEDPEELVNLAGDTDQTGRLAEMRVRLLDVLEARGDRLVQNPWMRDQLQNSRKIAPASRPE